MITDLIKSCKTIDEILRRRRPFALYRLPEEKTPRFLMQSTGDVRTINKIEALDGQRGFVIAPFHISPECPIVLIEPDVHQLEKVHWDSEPADVPAEEQKEKKPFNDGLKGYTVRFKSFLQALRSQQYDKLVFSRSVTLKRMEAFSPAAAFYKACMRFPDAYVYLCYTPSTGLWLGSTPEVLLSGKPEQFRTVALAGTQPLKDGQLPQIWTTKNREEQQYVSSYISQQLHSLGISYQESAPTSVLAGTLAHLKTDFRFSLSGGQSLGQLLYQLYPTPAVCGLPKEEAFQFILDHEGYNRSYYSGFIGWLQPGGKTDLYVNLRCMHITHRYLTFYAGGGLLSSSRLHEEWQETKAKMQTMRSLIAPSFH
ncbi:MAG: isochorismate synthase [Bacteroides sp.]